MNAQDLKNHSTALFGILTLSFVSTWGDLKSEFENLALCFNAYASFLDKNNNEQKRRQELTHPVREVGSHALLYQIPAAEFVNSKYSILDTALSQLSFYEFLFIDEEIHVQNKFCNAFERYDFIRNIGLSFNVNMLKYDPGGSLGATVFLWKVPEERAVNDILNATLKVTEKLKDRLPEFHTRRMRKEFVDRYCGLHSVTVPKFILRSIYSELSLNASSDQNPTVDSRVRQAILAEDPDMVLDLRHLNKGRPGETFQPFFDILAAKIEEITAADERRHNIEHLSKFLSVKDLINDVRADLPADSLIPSESTVLFSFAPKNAYINTARLYKSKIPLQFKVQTRQLRLSHPDEHFCAALYKYMRQFAHKFRDITTFVSIDDKSKIDLGEPGQYTSTGVRGKKSLIPVSSTLSALDHDVSSKGSLTPSVVLNVSVPEKQDGSFYQGSVSVTYKDSVFQPSSPWRHAAEMQGLLQETDINPILMIFSDGGPDHRLTYHSVKLSLIVLFKNLNLDLLVAGRTAPGHSWLNPVERIMSTLNIALQNTALARSECSAEKVPGLKQGWISSLESVTTGEDRKNESEGRPFQVS